MKTKFVECDVRLCWWENYNEKLKEGDSKLNLFLIFDTEFKCENSFDSHIKTEARMRDRTSQR